MNLLDQGSGIEGRRTIAAGAAIVLAVAACAKTTGEGIPDDGGLDISKWTSPYLESLHDLSVPTLRARPYDADFII